LDNLLAYILLLAPGLIVMLINERVGSHPSAKYTNTEKLVMAVLFSIPILIGNLVLLALKNCSLETANITVLQAEIKTLKGLIFYAVSSLLMAYVVSSCWNGFMKKEFATKLINKCRKRHNKAELNEGNLVWEDAFHGEEPQAVKVILKDATVFGSPVNMSENISDERCLLLADSKIVEDIVIEHNVPVDKVYVDTKSGVAVEIYNAIKFKEALYMKPKE